MCVCRLVSVMCAYMCVLCVGIVWWGGYLWSVCVSMVCVGWVCCLTPRGLLAASLQTHRTPQMGRPRPLPLLLGHVKEATLRGDMMGHIGTDALWAW